jgi:hypothetical protein
MARLKPIGIPEEDKNEWVFEYRRTLRPSTYK